MYYIYFKTFEVQILIGWIKTLFESIKNLNKYVIPKNF